VQAFRIYDMQRTRRFIADVVVTPVGSRCSAMVYFNTMDHADDFVGRWIDDRDVAPALFV
jgi:hypothetical protein